jgi:pimeloyl-ACP methyl ester carboxylesterase
MKRALLTSSFVALLSLASSGCHYAAYFVRDAHEPMQALEVRMDPTTRRECLVLFMPGMLDAPDSYREHGFLDDAALASRRCDLVALDAHFGYYREGTLRDRVGQDILRVAQARGYDEVWIVDISMGGLGTLMVAQDNPEIVRGVVLLAPFLGDEALVRSVTDAGLAQWDPPANADIRDAETFDAALWAWLQGYATHPEQMPAMYIGVGDDDRLRPGVELLAAVLPEGHHGTAPGGHNWTTWRGLFRRLLQSPPWDPSPAPDTDGQAARGQASSF